MKEGMAVIWKGIVLYRGYPKKGDTDSIMHKSFKGWSIEIITHEHFGKAPVKVFGINV